MNVKLSKEDMKEPDLFIKYSLKLWNFISPYKNYFMIGFVFLIVGTIGYLSYLSWKNYQNEKAFKAYYSIEKMLNTDKWEEQSPPPPINKEEVQKKLEEFIKKYPGLKASDLALLQLLNLFAEKQDWDQGLKWLEDQKQSQSFTSLLILNLKASFYAQKNKCDLAIPLWQEILKKEKASYLHPEVQLRMGICSESLHLNDEALAAYKKVMEKYPQSGASKAAQKYLKHLQASGTSEKK